MSELVINCPLDTHWIEDIVLNGERIPLMDHASCIEFYVSSNEIPMLKIGRTPVWDLPPQWELP